MDGKSPHRFSVEWTDYVLSLFSDDELVNGAPRTDALRRVAGLLLEKDNCYISNSTTEIKQATPDYVVAEHRIVVHNNDGLFIKQVSAAVDVRSDVLPAPYNKHLVASACTKAEGKALRRLLGVVLYTAEEIASDSNTGIVRGTSDPNVQAHVDKINDQQIMAMQTMAKRLNVDLASVIRLVVPDVQNLDSLSVLEGRAIISKLSELQRTEIDRSKLGEYSSTWREELK